MKTALWLYLFLFLAYFDLHAQYPILTPFAVSLGAGPAFIGWMMGMYSLTHLPGNLLAGVLIDRKGSRRFIIGSLVAAGAVLLLQAYAQLPWHLLLFRAASGFALAFLSPACLSLLASLSRDSVKQGKYMSGQGIVHTLASVLSPAAGAFIVAKAGFSGTFMSLGWLLIATGVMAYFSLPRVPKPKPAGVLSAGEGGSLAEQNGFTDEGIPHSKAGSAEAGSAYPANADPAESHGARRPISLRYFLLPFFVACAQGVLFFELPLSQTAKGNGGIMSTGILLSLLSLGALVTLSMLFLNQLPPIPRIGAALLGMALCFFALAAVPAVPPAAVLFLLGTAKGVLFPAIASLFIGISGPGRLGRTFSLQSIATSLGAFAGPVAAGQLRYAVSPYFIGFLLLMTALLLLPRPNAGQLSTASPDLNGRTA
ncbi:MFS transporter [Paenibacillus sp. HN-1]|uniref:MFS transporter n=1 Tax=Paenibacillus TaxID=44249 RepID=UPI001CA81947|nr:MULTISPECIES: MFS transporter [Paenibacillus]MBY9078875.1 MFS transporter [Paenibacillus sp. CGMCC 1.18879]MBY9082861.1 MFS transporter [Paenibacillus sinensis]